MYYYCINILNELLLFYFQYSFQVLVILVLQFALKNVVLSVSFQGNT